jgi:hypothetical protein
MGAKGRSIVMGVEEQFDLVTAAAMFDYLRFGPNPPRDWGDWELIADVHGTHLVLYDSIIDLEGCTSTARIVEWIQHFAEKSFPLQQLGGLVQALNDILHLKGMPADQIKARCEDMQQHRNSTTNRQVDE